MKANRTKNVHTFNKSLEIDVKKVEKKCKLETIFCYIRCWLNNIFLLEKLYTINLKNAKSDTILAYAKSYTILALVNIIVLNVS